MHLRQSTPNLHTLNLASNRLRVLYGARLPERLTNIDVSGNLISVIDSNTFKGLNHLVYINLKYSRISKISNNAFMLTRLNVVLMMGTGISHISPHSFSRSLSELYFPLGNMIDHVNLTGIHSLETLAIYSETKQS